MAKYHTLMTRSDNIWSPQFGDYDRKTVVEEVLEYVEEYGRANVKVVTCEDDTLNSLRMALMQNDMEYAI